MAIQKTGSLAYIRVDRYNGLLNCCSVGENECIGPSGCLEDTDGRVALVFSCVRVRVLFFKRHMEIHGASVFVLSVCLKRVFDICLRLRLRLRLCYLMYEGGVRGFSVEYGISRSSDWMHCEECLDTRL